MNSDEVDIMDINELNLQDIPQPCRGCVYWEFPQDFEKAKEDPSKKPELELKKKKWFEQAMKEFGTCGKIIYFMDKPIAYAQYAPSARFPNVTEYESKPVGILEDGVVFLSCLFIADEELRGKGLASRLLRNVVDELKRRGFRAIETFARRSEANNPSGPMEFYIKNGFHVKDNTNPEFPLMRLYL